MYNVNPKYNSDILDYCKLNNIDNVELFVSQCFKQGFDIKRYGLLGKTLNEGENNLKTGEVEEKHIIKEIIVEKLVEVPVDKIVEVPVEVIIEKEVIKEIPVEKVVTKVEYISDKTTEDELGGIIAELKNEMSKKDEKLDELRRSLDIALDKPPVEIIKEVEVIKEVERSNDKVIMLQDTLQKLRSEMKDKNTEIDSLKGLIKQLESRLNPTGAVYMKGSNINENL